MRLEGSLDAFGLPDVLQLLVSTSKTGTLRLRRLTPSPTSGHVRVQSGRIAGATSDEGREALARRLVAAGLIDRAALTAAVDVVERKGAPNVVDALLAAGAVGSDAYEPVARAQTTDAVFDLLRWTDGEFAFQLADPADEPGDSVSWDANEIVLEAQRRLGAWEDVSSRLPASDVPLRLVGQPGDEVVLGSDEWTIVRLIDGARSTQDLVSLIGKGEWETATTLAALVERGLIVASDGSMERELGASALLSRVEGTPEAPMEPPAAARMPAPRVETPPPAAPARSGEPVTDSTSTPLASPPATTFGLPPVTEPVPAPVASTAPVAPTAPPVVAPTPSAAATPSPVASGPAAVPTVAAPVDVAAPGAVGQVVGSVVTKPLPEAVAAPAPADDADAGVSRALLLRLIAGVRSL